MTKKLAIDPELPKTGNRVGMVFNCSTMKKIIVFIIGVFFIFCLNTAFTKTNIHSNASYKSDNDKVRGENMFFPIDVTFTSNQGCVVHIVGDLTLTVSWPPKVKKFNGTVTVSGPRGCPNGTLTFGNVSISSNQIIVDYSFDSDDPCVISNVTWSNADPIYLDLLNDPACIQLLVNSIHSGAGC